MYKRREPMMARLDFSAMSLLVLALATAVWSHPARGISELERRSSLSSSSSFVASPRAETRPSRDRPTRVYNDDDDEKLQADMATFGKATSETSETTETLAGPAGPAGLRVKRERPSTSRERELRDGRNLPTVTIGRGVHENNAQRQTTAATATDREAERRNMNNNHRLHREMENHWNRQN